MLHKLKQRNQEGFTIIEVLIVLAIAGLIMLVVFLAVPALQRNARNTQRKSDVSGLIGAYQEFVNNKGGTLPTQSSDFYSNAKVGYYTTAGNVTFAASPASVPPNVSTPGTAASATSVTTDQIVVVTGWKCGTDPTAAPTKDATRSVAFIYAIEAASGNGTYQCQST